MGEESTRAEVDPLGGRGGRRTITQMVVVGLIASILGIVLGLAIDWFPTAGSKQAGPIDTFWDVLIICSVPVFVLVTTVVLFAVRDFRMRPGQENLDGPPIHGNTRLEIAWTLIPTIIVLFGAGYSWSVLNEIEDRKANHVTVDVFSQQYAWSFAYPGKGYAYVQGEMHVPVNRQIQFKMHAQDVIHSFWVPEWRIKKDNVPGIVTTATVTPDKVGTYQLVCTELCGFGHATMRAKVVVEPYAKWKQWVEGLEGETPQSLMESVKQEAEGNPPAFGAGGA